MSLLDLKAMAFTETADYHRVLATLQEPSLLAEVRENAIQMDATRMQAAIDAGVFDAKPFVDAARAQPGVSEEIQSRWAERCQAMLAVMSNVDVDPDAIGPGGRAFALSFAMDEDVQDVLSSFVRHIADQAVQWKRAVMDDGPVRAVMNQTIHLACMMDEPNAMRRMASVQMESTRAMIDHQTIGVGVFEDLAEASQKGQLLVSPLFTAMQFSSTSCVVEILASGSPNPNLLERRKGDRSIGYDLAGSFAEVQHRGSTEAMTPVMAHVLKKAADSWRAPGEPERLSNAIHDVMHRYSEGMSSKNTQALAAAADAWVLNIEPERSILCALQYGFPDVVDHFKANVPWNAVAAFGEKEKDAPARMAMDHGLADGFHALIALAKDADPAARQAVLANFGDADGLRAGVSSDLTMTAAGISLLPKLLEIGLDPHSKSKGQTSTLFEDAKAADTAATGIMTSFVARSKAHDLIAEMEAPIKRPHP